MPVLYLNLPSHPGNNISGIRGSQDLCGVMVFHLIQFCSSSSSNVRHWMSQHEKTLILHTCISFLYIVIHWTDNLFDESCFTLTVWDRTGLIYQHFGVSSACKVDIWSESDDWVFYIIFSINTRKSVSLSTSILINLGTLYTRKKRLRQPFSLLWLKRGALCIPGIVTNENLFLKFRNHIQATKVIRPSDVGLSQLLVWAVYLHHVSWLHHAAPVTVRGHTSEFKIQE